MRDLSEWFLPGVIVTTAALCGLFIWAAVNNAMADRFSLRKDSWTCTRSHKEFHLQLFGKVQVPTMIAVCDQWTAK